ncbi:branched-chain amino acid ABC transporter substrate-binding protein [Pandoraea terrae]|uniref:Branched-chain amino acid ABC transporter substrate-binding protein n=1 Tax=Pandoraea terrae TaxID=1537710 RepID=A0A5E4U826_9BURK|nr:transporter substrate-binding protein [Pandoraea terrae]VVD95931.1 branched-chain amino acid ABC transporter substrate-binding protein [Pandoraea terrae]
MDRRSFIKTSAVSLAAASAGMPLIASAADEILVGGLHDLSGGIDIYGKPMVDCLTFAIEEWNAKGGLLGKKIRFINFDTQSNMQLYAQYSQQLALKDKVAVVHGGITSASREVVRPVLDRYRTLYFYNQEYEGGVCDRNTFCTGVTPAQTVAKLVPYAMKKWGKKVYVIAADYNYGQITSQWIKKYVKENGGTVSAIDYFPLDVTTFASTISKIESAKPDMIVSCLVGGSHMSFYRQWAAAGMQKKIPLASTTFGIGNEQIILSPSECDGFLLAYNYFESADNPVNKAFKTNFRKRFGSNYPNVTELAMSAYQGFNLWAEGVKKAGTVDRMKVIAALEAGVTIDTPSGKLSIDPATHHCIQNVSIAEVQDHQFKVLESFPAQPPGDTSAVCNLIRNPQDNRQYTIKF